MTWIVRKLHTLQEDNEIYGMHVDKHFNIYCAVYHEALFRISKDNILECVVKDETLEGAEITGIKGNDDFLYGCDLFHHGILSYAFANGKLKYITGTGIEGHKDGNTKDAMFRFPAAITMDKNNNLYIGEYCRVRKVNLIEDTVQTIATLQCSLYGGLAVDKDGTIYGTDYRNHCIQQIKNGEVTTVAGVYAIQGQSNNTLKNSRFSNPHGIALCQDGALLVADKNGIRRVDMACNKVSTLLPNMTCLRDITCLVMDDNGDIYVSTTNTIYKLENTWKWERILWLGHLKEDSSSCFLASLYKDLVRLIASYLRVQEPIEEEQKSKKRKCH